MSETFMSWLAENQTREADAFLDWVDWEDGEFMSFDPVDKRTLERKWREWAHITKTNM